MLVGIIFHGSAAGDNESAALIQRPGDITAAAAADQNAVNELPQGKGDSVAHGVIVGIAALRNAQHHAAAALEGDLVNAACAQRHINAGQLVAIAKAAVADGLHALRQDDLRQAGIQTEGQAADGLQLAALFERDAGQIGRTVEGICADGGDVRADLHAADPGPVLGPGLRVLVGIIHHSASAGNDKPAALIQCPYGTAAAKSAGQNTVNKFPQGKGDPVAHGVIVGIAALRNAQHHAAAALEGDLVNAACAQRHINAGQLVAIAKAAVADGLHALRQDDLRQAGIQTEGQAADGLQLAALFERDAGQIGRTVEGICADGGDVRADLHAADPGPVLGPGLRVLVGIIHHSAAAGDNKSAALIQRPGDVAAAAAAGQNAAGGLSQGEGDLVVHGVIMGIAAFHNVQHHAAAGFEGQRLHTAHALGNINTAQL